MGLFDTFPCVRHVQHQQPTRARESYLFATAILTAFDAGCACNDMPVFVDGILGNLGMHDNTIIKSLLRKELTHTKHMIPQRNGATN